MSFATAQSLGRRERLNRADAYQASLVTENLAAELRLAVIADPRTPVHYYTMGKELTAPAYELIADQWEGRDEAPLVQLLELISLSARGEDMQAAAQMWLELRCRQFADNNLSDAMFVLGGEDDEATT